LGETLIKACVGSCQAGSCAVTDVKVINTVDIANNKINDNTEIFGLN